MDDVSILVSIDGDGSMISSSESLAGEMTVIWLEGVEEESLIFWIPLRLSWSSVEVLIEFYNNELID